MFISHWARDLQKFSAMIEDEKLGHKESFKAIF